MRRARVLESLILVPALLAAAPRAPAPREPAVAGRFYPDDAARLGAAVRGFLADAVPQRGEPPIALVVPHAGYIFSGQIAADGFRQVQGRPYDVVVVLGTNHTAPELRGVSIYAGPGFRTPLGVAEVDARLARELIAADPAFVFDPAVHEREHSVEVQVPFVQVALPGVRIVPAIVAGSDPGLPARFGRALAKAAAGRKVLVVASSDLSHYPAYDDARASDAAVLAAVAALDSAEVRRTIAAEMRRGRPNLETCACGEAPILAAIEAAKALGATRGVVLSYANSGDTAVGNTESVVGYGAVALVAGPPGADVAALARREVAPTGGPLGAAEGRALLELARRSIERFAAGGVAPLARDLPPALERRQGVFVTLRERGALRGCVGHTGEDVPLGRATGMMALQAAFNDSRFEPLAPSEIAGIEIEVSVLTPLTRIAGPAAIVLGDDGVALRKAGRSALFLPEVAAENGWDTPTLLENLCAKAGLPAGAWRTGAELFTFRTVRFRESGRR